MPAPADCYTKEEVRAEIDRIDSQLIGLLAERFAYVRRMAALKREPSDAYDRQRIEAILSRVRAEAEARGLDPDLAQSLWQQLIDWNVAYEARTIGSDHG
jgi:isochorismate pyruvate lyase